MSKSGGISEILYRSAELPGRINRDVVIQDEVSAFICFCTLILVSRGQTAVFFLGGQENRVWDISDTQIVLRT